MGRGLASCPPPSFLVGHFRLPAASLIQLPNMLLPFSDTWVKGGTRDHVVFRKFPLLVATGSEDSFVFHLLRWWFIFCLFGGLCPFTPFSFPTTMVPKFSHSSPFTSLHTLSASSTLPPWPFLVPVVTCSSPTTPPLRSDLCFQHPLGHLSRRTAQDQRVPNGTQMILPKCSHSGYLVPNDRASSFSQLSISHPFTAA